jgi:quinol monooxygenase YgiN
MTFVQIIEYQTSRLEELQALAREFREGSAQQAGASKPLRGSVAADQERPGHYLSMIEFESADAAMEASKRPETQEFFARMSALMDGPPTFYNLAVVETWEMP